MDCRVEFARGAKKKMVGGRFSCKRAQFGTGALQMSGCEAWFSPPQQQQQHHHHHSHLPLDPSRANEQHDLGKVNTQGRVNFV